MKTLHKTLDPVPLATWKRLSDFFDARFPAHTRAQVRALLTKVHQEQDAQDDLKKRLKTELLRLQQDGTRTVLVWVEDPVELIEHYHLDKSGEVVMSVFHSDDEVLVKKMRALCIAPSEVVVLRSFFKASQAYIGEASAALNEYLNNRYIAEDEVRDMLRHVKEAFYYWAMGDETGGRK